MAMARKAPEHPQGTVNNSAFGNTAATNQVAGIPLTAGQSGVGYNFGELAGSLGGTVYVDLNANGAFDNGEPGIPSVTLALTGTDVLGNPVNLTTTTNASGNYSFSGLLTANASGYTVTETQPATYLDGQDSKGLIGGVACAACNTATPNNIKSIPFQPGSSFIGFNFGEVLSASLAGSVYVDINNNSILDTGEALSGVTLTLSGTNDLGAAVNLTTTTNAGGAYSFTNLRPSSAAGYNGCRNPAVRICRLFGRYGDCRGNIRWNSSAELKFIRCSGFRHQRYWL
ncbi:MAG: SdrD B-like domain-containing protein, partial [Nitrosomonadales bacterium]